MPKTKLTVTSCRKDGRIDQIKSFIHYNYKGRGLAIPFRQHILREIMRMDAGEIGSIRIVSRRNDAN